MEDATVYGEEKIIHVELQGKEEYLNKAASDFEEDDDTAYGPFASFDKSGSSILLLLMELKHANLVICFLYVLLLSMHFFETFKQEVYRTI